MSIAKPKVKKKNTKALVAKLDALAGAACRERGYCEAHSWKQSTGFTFKCSSRMEWAHIKSRGYRVIRHDPLNCVCLCNICHRFFTQNPNRFTEFINWLDPERWSYLEKKLLTKTDYDYWLVFYARGND